VWSAGDLEQLGGGAVQRAGIDGEFLEHGTEAWAVGVEGGEQQPRVQVRWCVLPAVAERVGDRTLEVRADRQLAQRAGRSKLPADGAAIQVMQGGRARCCPARIEDRGRAVVRECFANKALPRGMDHSRAPKAESQPRYRRPMVTLLPADPLDVFVQLIA
jgi:hypothetical protein